MDAMISRCVDEINLSEKQLREQREGKDAPMYSWDTDGEWRGSIVLLSVVMEPLFQVPEYGRKSVHRRSALCVRH